MHKKLHKDLHSKRNSKKSSLQTLSSKNKKTNFTVTQKVSVVLIGKS